MKVGRNDPCPCGSGSKYKKCCLPKDEAQSRAQPAASAPASDRATPKEPLRFGPLIPAGQKIEETPDEQTFAEPELPRSAPRREYPRVDDVLPQLSPSDEKLVDDWWEQVKPFYIKQRDADQMLRRVVQFLETRPDLFPHLALHEEFLFELGAELGRRQRWSDYIRLLRRLRQEQPRTYSFCFGYYDRDIIYELAIAGRAEEIPAFFGFFRQYPDSHPDSCHTIINFLAWRGLAQPLFELGEAVAVPMATSKEVVGGGFALDWLIFREHVPFLDANDSSAAAAAQIEQNLLVLAPEIPWRLDRELIRRNLEMAIQLPAVLELHEFKPREERWLIDLLWNFKGQLHFRKGVPWVQAQFLADRLEDFVFWCADRNHDPFQFKEPELENFLVRTCKDFFWMDGVRAVSMLQAAAWFAEYLPVTDIFPEAGRQAIITTCSRLFEKTRKTVDSTDPAYRLSPTFERLMTNWGEGSLRVG